jgi:nonsense-mediated mRNA decay protein 3
LKYNVHTNTTNIKERSDGLDFYFSHKNHASKFVDFIQSVAPVRFKVSEKLISHDEKNNTANIKYSFSVEIIPLCRDDLVCLPKKLSSSLGNINPLLLCDRVTSFARLIDPLTLQTCDITSQIFWNSSFRSICSSKQLIEYIILDIVPLGPTNGKYILADVQCVRAKDFGVNDNMFFAKTHLGHILKPGDSVLGYDLSTTIFNDSDLTSLKGKIMPDLILVKKCYPKRSSLRYWKLKTLDKEKNEEEKKMDIEKSNKEYEEFLKDIEEDPELRSNINLYKTKNFENIYKQRHQELENEMTDEKLDIELEELLDDLTLEEE